MTIDRHQRVRRMMEASAGTDANARDVGADDEPCKRAVTAEVRATVASVLTSRRGTVYRFGSLVVAFDGGGRFHGVGVEFYNGVALSLARPVGRRW